MKIALLVIDPQKIYTDKDSDMFCKDATRTIARINSLIEMRNHVNKRSLLFGTYTRPTVPISAVSSTSLARQKTTSTSKTVATQSSTMTAYIDSRVPWRS